MGEKGLRGKSQDEGEVERALRMKKKRSRSGETTRR